MRRKSSLIKAVLLVAFGAVVLYDGTAWALLAEHWQWAGVFLGLVILVLAQVILVRRHLFTLPAGRTRMPAPAGPAVERAAFERPGAGAAAGKDSAPTAAAEAAAGKEAPVLDGEIFSRFREHLERVERGEIPNPVGRTPYRAPASEDEVEDRVEISSTARGRSAKQRTPPSRAPRPSPAGPEEPDGPDLFDDLRPAPMKTPAAGQHAPGEAEPARRDVAGAPANDPSGRPAAETSALDEVGAALQPTDRDTGLADEAAMLLKLAEEAAAGENWDGLRAGLDNYLAHLNETPELMDWRARRLQVRLAVRDRNTGGALQGFEDMLAAGYRPDTAGVPGLLDELLSGADPAAADHLRVSMLVRILAAFRQKRDQQAMDTVFLWIEEAQERAGDEQRLLKTLKNHLEIRKAMGDLPGQLELIDQIGNRCFRLDLTEEARTFYEMGLKLRGEDDQTEGAESPGESGGNGTSAG